MEQYGTDLSVILVGAALLSSLAVYLKQPILIAYILCGVLVGPWGLGWVNNVQFVEVVSHLGITLLLFLAGLCLHPQNLLKLFKATSLITMVNCGIAFAGSFGLALAFGFPRLESFCIGLAFMFSSTILCIKLLPTVRLHQEYMGAVCIAILIAQDMLAMAALAFLRCINAPEGAIVAFVFLSLKLAGFIAFLILFEQFVLSRLMAYVEKMHEMLFVLGLAWCFGIASLSHGLGLFYETGAFFSGVVLARHRISQFLSEELKPLRDFFLVMFFFSLGAKLDPYAVWDVAVPALVMTGVWIAAKPWLFAKSFALAGESRAFGTEVGFRLGQMSEFSLLLAVLATKLGHIGPRAFALIQLVTILTFVLSSYLVVFRYPTPIGVSKKLAQA